MGGGDETTNEMCIGFFLYYPLVEQGMDCMTGNVKLDIGDGDHTCRMPGQQEQQENKCDGNDPGDTSMGKLPSSSVDLPTWLQLHIAFMYVGMGLLLPAGVLIAMSFRKGTDDAWFRYHRITVMIGLLFVLIGCLVAFFGVTGTHLEDVHQKLGVGVFVLALTQPLNAF